MTVKIKNWKKFQHFKDRRPPWIKLYRDLLDDPDWHDLSGDDAKALVMIWLIASEDDGALPDSRKLAFRLRITQNKAEQLLNKLSHWLEQDDIKTISPRYQDDAPETETETETETDIRAVAFATRTHPFDEFKKAYPKREGANPWKPARKAFDAALRAGTTADEIIAGARACAAKDADKIGTPYIPQAVRWLRDERWKDYAPTGPPRPIAPDPSLPSREELLKRYAVDRRPTTETAPETASILEGRAGICGDEPAGMDRYFPRNGSTEIVGKILPMEGIRTVRATDSEEGTSEEYRNAGGIS